MGLKKTSNKVIYARNAVRSWLWFLGIIGVIALGLYLLVGVAVSTMP